MPIGPMVTLVWCTSKEGHKHIFAIGLGRRLVSDQQPRSDAFFELFLHTEREGLLDEQWPCMVRCGPGATHRTIALGLIRPRGVPFTRVCHQTAQQSVDLMFYLLGPMPMQRLLWLKISTPFQLCQLQMCFNTCASEITFWHKISKGFSRPH